MIRFCTQCAGSVRLHIPVGDNLPRHVCICCGHIHYENPRLIVGCIATWEGKVLLCRRAIEPRLGFWTLPAGFMENGETTSVAAARETLEEACAKVDIGAPFSMVNVAHIGQVHLFYLGRLPVPEFGVGSESLETKLFTENEIPWKELAFRSVDLCLKQFFADRSKGNYEFHTADIPPV